MKKMIILIIILGIAYGLNMFHLPNAEVLHAQTVLSLGIVLLAAFTLAEIGLEIGLPMVTGFILAGLFLGPESLNILSSDVVKQLKMFNNLAVGLIALGAGLEFNLKKLFRDGIALSYTVILKLLFLFLLITPFFYLFESTFHFLGITSVETIVMSLIFFALAIGTSPAIVLAILSETKANGRIASLVLNNAIVKDLVVVVTIAIVLTFSKSLLLGAGGSGEGVGLSVLGHLFSEIGLSIAVGAIVGIVAFLYLTYINFENFIFLIALIIGVNEISESFHLETLLIFITAGAFINNMTQKGEELHHLMGKISLPIFVIFFTNAGAAIQIRETLPIFPLAFLLFSLRLISFYFAGRIGAKMAGEQDITYKNIWMGYIPQAGVTLGLVEIASRTIPQLSSQIMLLGMGIIALNLISGPVFLKFSLKLGGEFPKDNDGSNAANSKKHEIKKTIAENLSWPFYNQNTKNHDQISNNNVEIILNQKNVLPHINKFIKSLELIFQDHWDKEIRSGLKDFFQSINLLIDDQFLNDTTDEQNCKCVNKSLKNISFLWTKRIEENISQILKESNLLLENQETEISFYDEKEKVNYILPFKTVIKTHFTLVILKILKNQQDEIHGKFFNLFSSYFIESSTLKKLAFDEITIEIHNSFQNIFDKETNLILPSLFKGIDLYGKDSSILKKNRLSLTYENTNFLKNTLYKNGVAWNKLIFSLTDTFISKKNIELINKVILNGLDTYFLKTFENALLVTDKKIKLLSQSVDFIKNVSVTEVTKNIETIEKKIDQLFYFDNEHRSNNVDQYQINNDFHRFVKNIESAFMGTEAVISEKQENYLFENPAFVFYHQFHFINTFNQMILVELLPSFEDIMEDATNLFENLSSEINEVVAQTNAAMKKIKVAKEKDEELERNLETSLAKILSNYNKMKDYIEIEKKELHQIRLKSVQYVIDRLNKRSVIENAKGRLGLIQEFTQSYIDKLFPTFKKLSLGAFKSFFYELYSMFSADKKFENFLKEENRPMELKKLRKMTTELSEFFNEILKLPHYQECFTLLPIKSPKYLIANREIHQLVNQHFQTWKKKKSSMVVHIIGENGSGKTSLLNIFQHDFAFNKIYRISDTYDVKKLGIKEALNIASGKRFHNFDNAIVICDDIDHWSIKSNNAYEDFIRFTNLLSSWRYNTFWIFTSNKINQPYLNTTFNFNLLMKHVHHLKKVNFDVAKEILESRQLFSGGQVALEQKRIFSKILSDKKIIEQKMRNIHFLSNGNILSLIFHYLINVKNVELDDHLKTYIRTKINAIQLTTDLVKYLPGNVYLVLRYLVSYGESSLDELEYKLKIDKTDINIAVQFLINMDFASITSKSLNRIKVHTIMKYLISGQMGNHPQF